MPRTQGRPASWVSDAAGASVTEPRRLAVRTGGGREKGRTEAGTGSPLRWPSCRVSFSVMSASPRQEVVLIAWDGSNGANLLLLFGNLNLPLLKQRLSFGDRLSSREWGTCEGGGVGSEARLHPCPGRVAAWRRVPASWPQGPRQHRDGMPKSHNGLEMHIEHRTSWDGSLGRWQGLPHPTGLGEPGLWRRRALWARENCAAVLTRGPALS